MLPGASRSFPALPGASRRAAGAARLSCATVRWSTPLGLGIRVRDLKKPTFLVYIISISPTLRGPVVGPSRCSNIFLSGNSAWCNVHTALCRGRPRRSSMFLIEPLRCPVLTVVPSAPRISVSAVDTPTDSR